MEKLKRRSKTKTSGFTKNIISSQFSKNNISKFNIKNEPCALKQAQIIGKTSRQIDFDWDQPRPVLKKVKEEYLEVKEAFKKADMKNLEEEIGDLLFAVVQFARHNNIDAEIALGLANQKFIDRLSVVFDICEERKKDYFKTTFSEKDELWKLAKKRVKQYR